ncbi:MAG: DNA ligase D [Gammaproteobacteria bacterium]
MATRKKTRKPGKQKALAALKRYRAKRDFNVTSEPADGGLSTRGTLQFVVQKHWASTLHYDLRLELKGTMKSWAVPKGPSFDPADKRMAVHVEDHPLAYNSFEGQIPEKQYGAGKVIIWDKGSWEPTQDAAKGYRAGKLKFQLHGHKLKGGWTLVRMRGRQEKQDPWLLIKERDAEARPASEFSVIDEMPDSVATLQTPRSASKGRLTTRSAGNRDGMPSSAVRKSPPATLAPVLATLVDRPPADPDKWVFEIKFDGYRMLARIGAGGVRLFTRNGHDWTAKLPHLSKTLKGMRLKPGWLDGEIVMPRDGDGSPSFQALQNAFDTEKTRDIVYYAFDVPYYAGRDLTRVPLEQRRAVLKDILADPPDGIRFSDAFEAPPDQLVASACKLGLEGVIGKRRDSHYSGRRTPDWIKLKCSQRQDFVIVGWTDPQGSREGLGALLLGVRDAAGKLGYAGKVGTGFNARNLAQIHGNLKKLATKQATVQAPAAVARTAHWVRPTLIAEVSFAEWTANRHIRHPVFHALRTDKPARKPPAGAAHSTLPAGLRVSHPDRIIDASLKATKIEVVRYYGLVGPLMMEHLRGRPVSLVRAPDGVQGEMFFQKHLERYRMDGVAELPRTVDRDHAPFLEIASPMGLLSAAQMNVIEFHTWNAMKTHIDRPDRMTFDLDPGQGVDWKAVQQAAGLVRTLLDELGLRAFLKTSGGKGLHLVTPIRRQYDWDTVKGFSQAVVEHMAETLPRFFVAKSGPRNRVGRIFIDYLRNGFGATTACAWSLRARPGLGISVPIAWDELPRVRSAAQWGLRDIHQRLDEGNAPWKGYSSSATSLTPAMKKLGVPAAD